MATKEKLKGLLILVTKYLLIFIILIAIYLGLLIITSLIPSSWLEKNVIDSSEILVKEGEKVFFDLGYKQESIFTFTDALMINTAYSIDSTHPLQSSILDRKNYIPGQTKIVYPDSQYNLGANEKYKDQNGNLYQTKELYGLMHEEQIEDSFEYARYWHGYLTILRPLLLLFNYSAIRIVLFIFTLVSIITLIFLLCKKISIVTGIIYGISLMAINIFIVTKSINEILIFIVAFISSIILLLKKDTRKNIGLFFFAVGSISNFIDLLTAPLVTLGLTAITYFLIIQKNAKLSIKEYIVEILKIGISWVLGYGITWIIKWVIVQVFFGRPIITQAIEQALYRTNAPVINGEEIFGSFDVIIRNLKYLSNTVIVSILIIVIAYLTVSMIRNYKKKINMKENLKDCIPYIIIFFFPIIWYSILKQHSYIHVFFTYRLWIISIISILIVVTNIFKDNKIERSDSRK